MATTAITGISNLTQGTSVDANELTKYKLSDSMDAVTGAALDPDKTKGFALATDNIQVTWTVTDKATKAHRSVGGKWVPDTTGANATISNLMDVSKYSIGLTGAIDIGPGGKAASLSVSFGNFNPGGEWIIDFSNKRDGATGSEIHLQDLIDWIRDNNKAGAGKDDTDAKLPEIVKTDDPNKAKLTASQFTIQFKSFYFNITRGTFDFWVKSSESESITFGNFTIKSIGFRVTNVPVPLPASAQETKELPAPATDESKDAK
jgi:hypothetical protein